MAITEFHQHVRSVLCIVYRHPRMTVLVAGWADIPRRGRPWLSVRGDGGSDVSFAGNRRISLRLGLCSRWHQALQWRLRRRRGLRLNFLDCLTRCGAFVFSGVRRDNSLEMNAAAIIKAVAITPAQVIRLSQFA
jgi:hypothetical protein